MALAFIVSSCQKEIKGELIIPIDTLQVSDRIKTFTQDISTSSIQYSETFTLTYDNSGRVINLVSAQIPGNYFNYNYAADNTYTLDIVQDSISSIHIKYFLNSFSLVDSSIQWNDANDTSTEKYTYNSSRQLVNLKQYNYTLAGGSVLYNSHDYSYDSNGNLSEETDGTSTTKYDYYTNYLNNISIGERYFYTNTHLTKTTYYATGSSNGKLDHTYTFDSNNRVLTEKQVSSAGDVILKTYTYY